MEDRFQTKKSWWKQKFKELKAFCNRQSTLAAPLEPEVQATKPEPNVRALKPKAQPFESNVSLIINEVFLIMYLLLMDSNKTN